MTLCMLVLSVVCVDIIKCLVEISCLEHGAGMEHGQWCAWLLGYHQPPDYVNITTGALSLSFELGMVQW